MVQLSSERLFETKKTENIFFRLMCYLRSELFTHPQSLSKGGQEPSNSLLHQLITHTLLQDLFSIPLLQRNKGRGVNINHSHNIYIPTSLSAHQVDTIVMANLGYFQLKANPGAWLLKLRNGRSAEIYSIARLVPRCILHSIKVWFHHN